MKLSNIEANERKKSTSKGQAWRPSGLVAALRGPHHNAPFWRPCSTDTSTSLRRYSCLPVRLIIRQRYAAYFYDANYTSFHFLKSPLLILRPLMCVADWGRRIRPDTSDKMQASCKRTVHLKSGYHGPLPIRNYIKDKSGNAILRIICKFLFEIILTFVNLTTFLNWSTLFIVVVEGEI